MTEPNRRDPDLHRWQQAASARARHRAMQRLKAENPQLWARYYDAARIEEGLPVTSGRAWTWARR
jgi:hypothetical protein